MIGITVRLLVQFEARALMLLGCGNSGGDISMKSKTPTNADNSIFMVFGPTSIDGTANIIPYYPYRIFSTDAAA